MKLRVLVFSLVIVAIGYANAVPHPFVQTDDFSIVAANQGIRSIAPLRFLSEPYWAGYKFGGIYRPLTILSFSVDYAIWHRWAPGFRLTNLLLHSWNGYLVFLLASTFIGATGAWAAMVVYLLHPVHTEAIVGIVGRAELLAAAFFFGAWLMCRRGRIGWARVIFLFELVIEGKCDRFPSRCGTRHSFVGWWSKEIGRCVAAICVAWGCRTCLRRYAVFCAGSDRSALDLSVPAWRLVLC